MKFKHKFLGPENGEEVPLNSVGWVGQSDVITCGDDGNINQWNLLSNEFSKLQKLPESVYPMHIHIYDVKNLLIAKQRLNEQLILAATDGKFYIIGKNQKFEKIVSSHKGATLVCIWSPDGNNLLSGGEDGLVKLYSKSGMLRSTLAKENHPIYSAAWNADSNKILYTNYASLIIKSLTSNLSCTRWKAHNGLILKVDWSCNNNLIISGGEDRKYKIWDEYGVQLYSSSLGEHPISSLSWDPSGDFFAVGSFNMLRLCDKAGWSYSVEKVLSGSIYAISWSTDGTQIAAACSNGRLLIGRIIERNCVWENYEASLVRENCVEIKDISSDMCESMECAESITRLSMAYKHVIATTATQCHIYSVSNFNVSNIIELKDGSVSYILQSAKYFALVEKCVVNVYTYEGSHYASPKWPNMRCHLINKKSISLSDDILAVRDQIDIKAIHFADMGSSIVIPVASHNIGISEIALNQDGSLTDRCVAFIDRNKDLYVALVTVSAGRQRRIVKLGIMMESIAWNSDFNFLCGIKEGSLVLWCNPVVAFNDQRLLTSCKVVKESKEFDRNASIISFHGNTVQSIKHDGCVIQSILPPYFAKLYYLTKSADWMAALSLCRVAKDNTLWACLAGYGLQYRDLITAELGYAAIEMYDKVLYIRHIRGINDPNIQAAEIFMLFGNIDDAETTLLQHGHIFRAIHLNVTYYRWQRALQLASKYKTHVDTVIYYRNEYLSLLQKEEYADYFLELKGVELDEDIIREKVTNALKEL